MIILVRGLCVMKIGNRLFPFPILNNSNKLYSGYKDSCKFELQCSQVDDGKRLTLSETYCILESDFLNSLVSSGRAKILLYVECPQTFFRKTYEIGLEPKDIVLSYYDICGPFSLVAFIVANEDIENVSSTDFRDEYMQDGLSFYIDKHDILAVDEYNIGTVDVDDKNEKLNRESIFVVALNLDPEAKTVKYDHTGQKIYIYLPEQVFQIYKETGKIYKEIYLAMLGVSSLTEALLDLRIKNPDLADDTIENLKIKYMWFRVFCSTYENTFGKSFSLDEYDDLEENVQKAFGCVIYQSIEKINDLTFKEDNHGY